MSDIPPCPKNWDPGYWEKIHDHNYWEEERVRMFRSNSPRRQTQGPVRNRHLTECVRQISRWWCHLDDIDSASDALLQEVLDGVEEVRRGGLGNAHEAQLAPTSEWKQWRRECGLEEFSSYAEKETTLRPMTRRRL